MHTSQLVGNIGPFLDPASGQQVHGTLQGNFTFVCNGDPNAVVQHLQAGILRATTTVLQQKLAANQVALPTMAMSMPSFVPEIIAQSGAQSMGVQITQLNLTPSVQSPAMVAPPAMGAMPPNPYQATANAAKQVAQQHLDPRNYEVEAQVNVGGYKIKASTDGGLDTEGLKNQVVDKAKSTVIWWAIGCGALLFVGLLLVGIAGYGYYAYSQTAAGVASGDGEEEEWDGKSPYTCGGNKKVTLKSVKADLSSGTAVTASANCQVTLEGSTIKAPTALEASGNAKITVKGGSVTGTTAAAKASGLAVITFEGTTVSGKKDATAPAKIVGP